MEAKKRANAEGVHILDAMTSKEAKNQPTLLAAKSWGGRTALKPAAESIFVEMEQVFRNLFPSSTTSMDKTIYLKACVDSAVVQDCFFYCYKWMSRKGSKRYYSVKYYFIVLYRESAQQMQNYSWEHKMQTKTQLKTELFVLD